MFASKFRYDSCYYCYNCKWIPKEDTIIKTETMRSQGPNTYAYGNLDTGTAAAGYKTKKFKLKRPRPYCRKCGGRIRTRAATPKLTRARLNPMRIE